MIYEPESLYELRKRAPLWWHNKSSDLRASAGSIWLAIKSDRTPAIADELELGDGFDVGIACYPVYRMLCGMSLELIYKALVVVEKKEVSHSHNLVFLAEQAGLNYSTEAKAILAVLTESIIWHGRYPVPKSEQDMHRAADLERRGTSKPVGRLGKKGPIICRRSEALEWNGFNQIWGDASEEFFKRYG